MKNKQKTQNKWHPTVIGERVVRFLAARPFTFRSYPSSLFTSDIPVQGLVAALRQAEKQRQVVPQGEISTPIMTRVEEMERELQGS